PVADRALGGALQVDVEREAQRVAAARVHLRLDGARRAPARVDGELRAAVAAAHVAVVLRLDPALADDVAEAVAEPPPLLQLRRGDLAGIAEDLRSERLVRVLAQVALGELHAG